MEPISNYLRRSLSRKPSYRKVLVVFTTLNLGILFSLFFGSAAVMAQTSTTGTGDLEYGLGMLGAGLAIAGSCIGAGVAVAAATSAGAAAIVEKPSAFGSVLIFAGLGEGIAIYGLLIAFQILSKIP